MILLPRYILEKQGTGWIVWDTVEHEETGYESSSKEEMSAKAKNLNERESKIRPHGNA